MTIEAVTYVEIDINYCQNTYGVAPCTAEVGVTGADKCYNTRNVGADCQDTANFNGTAKTLRFTLEHTNVPNSIDAIPSMISADVGSPMLKPGESLGERTTATITFRNHPHGDAGLDLYIADRAYIPFEQGTFWGKFRARNPYIKGRPIRIYRGFSDQALEDMEVIHLFVDNFSGPTVKGIYTIKCVDALRFLDGDKAQAPAVSSGYLSAGILAGAGSATLEPAGIGDAEYPASGKVAIGEEICSFTRSGDVLTLTARGLHETEDADHDEEDAVQVCLEYTGQRVDEIIYDLIDNYTDVDAATRINANDWEEEITSYSPVLYTCKPIPKPTSVAQLINELIVQAGLVINDDVVNKKIKLRTLRPVPSTAPLFSEENVLKGTFSPRDQQEKRATLVITYYNQKNPFENLDDKKNYYSVLATLSDIGEYDQLAIRTIFSRWIPQFGRSVVQQLNSMLVSRYSLPPRLIAFDLLRDRNRTVIEGEGARVQSPALENADGSLQILPSVIVSTERLWDKTKVMAEELQFTELPTLERLIVIETNALNLNLRTIYDQVYSGVESGDEVKFIIENGVKVGSNSENSNAVTVGDWPSGVDLLLVVNGRIQGAGGDGALGSKAAKDGGTALYTRYAITVDVTNGEIWGGGGGGDNQTRTTSAGIFYSSTGGAGAGYVPGNVGTPGTTEAGGGYTRTIAGDGTTLQGFAGGGPGLPGDGIGGTGAGSADAGNAVDGASYVTFVGTGDRRGGEIN